MTDWTTPATPAQLTELRLAAAELGEDIPDGLRAHEAAQRLGDLRRQLKAAAAEGIVILEGQARPVEEVHTALL